MDTIGDFLTRIRNAGMAKHDRLDIPSSKSRVGIAKILEDKGYIRSFKVAKDNKQGLMRVYLKYDKEGNHVISQVHRISKPSRRVYIRSNEIKPVRSGFGLSVLSTNKGIISGDDAANQNVGGELLFEMW
ncbi:MAG: 30S ribosomal protein S8 [Bdellovibrionales bacterium]|nr:30S ribosomal protein S8 [Bdellovibrionales bacterium]